jgi:hypothetical protein
MVRSVWQVHSAPLRFAQDDGFRVRGSSKANANTEILSCAQNDEPTELVAFAEIDDGLDLGVEEFLGLLDHWMLEGFCLD